MIGATIPTPFREKTLQMIFFAAMIAVVLAMGLFIWNDVALIFPALCFGITFVYAAFHYPVAWLYAVVGTLGFLIYDKNEGIEPLEAALIASYIATLVAWLWHYVFVQRQRIVQNYGDVFLMLFFIFLPANAIVSVMNGVPFFQWLRESHHFILLLYYIPIRHYIRNKQLLFVFGGILVVEFIVLGILNIYYYKSVASNAVLAFQLVAARGAATVHSSFFPICVPLAIVVYVYAKHFLVRIAGFIFIVSSVGSGLVLMSRTTWAAMALSIAAFLFLTKSKHRRRYLGGILTATIILIVGVVQFGGNNKHIIYNLLSKRLLSTSNTKDRSLMSRNEEIKVLWVKIQEYPLGGSGIGTKYVAYDPIWKDAVRRAYVHNGYVSMPFKLGIPLAAVYLLFYLSYFALCLKGALSFRDINAKALASALSLGYIAFFIYNALGCVFDARTGMMSAFLLAGLYSAAENIERSQRRIAENLRISGQEEE